MDLENLKDRIKNLLFSLFCSSLVSVVVNLLILPSLKIQPSISLIVVISIVIFVLISVIVYFRLVVHYYNNLVINSTDFIETIENIKIMHNGKEKQFESECLVRIVHLLNAIITLQESRKVFTSVKAKAWAALFIPDKDKLKLIAQSNRAGFSKFAWDLSINSTNYLPAYCYHYDNYKCIASKKIMGEEKRIALQKKRMIYNGIIVMPHGFEKYDEHDCLEMNSGMGACLKHNDEKIAVLILGADKRNYYRRTDAKAICLMRPTLIAELIHYAKYCPWHKMGWREQKDKANITVKEFTFSPQIYNEYFDRSRDTSIESVKDIYKDLVASIVTGEIEKVFICGTFNGWNTQHLSMDRITDNSWVVNLHLPKGYYEYKYYVKFKDNREVGITKNWIFDINSQYFTDIKYGGLVSCKVFD